jgi:NAD(P)-dependent dehydrogenase (short-subunit alcohol dehydrogenase family)
MKTFEGPYVQRLQDRVVIVTGAAGTIGSAVARRCGREGALVVATDVHEEPLASIGAEIGADSGRGATMACDISEPIAAKHIVSTAIERFGTVHALINCAYWHPPGKRLAWHPAQEESLDSWEMSHRVGPRAMFLLCQAVFPYMREQGEGRIVNFGSEASENPEAGYMAYAAAKGAIRSMTKAMASDWGRFGITVNTLWPSAVAALSAPPSPARAQHIAETALGRLGDPYEDIAPVVVFLISDEAKYITGQTIVANGGRTKL